MELMLFYFFATLSIICGVMIIVSKRAITSALNLVLVLFCMAALYAILEAHLIAVLQVLVYAGAIMVLFMFVIMLLNLREKEGFGEPVEIMYQLLGIGALSALLVPAVMTFKLEDVPGIVARTAEFGTTAGVGKLLYTEYLLPFEIASVLLLVALLGAVVLGKTKLR